MQRVTDSVTHYAMRDIGSPALASAVGPMLVPAMLATGFKITKEAQPPDTLQELPFAIHFRYGISLAPVYDMEFAFPIILYGNQTDVPKDVQLDGIKKLLDAIQIVIEETQKSASKSMIKKNQLSIM